MSHVSSLIPPLVHPSFMNSSLLYVVAQRPCIAPSQPPTPPLPSKFFSASPPPPPRHHTHHTLLLLRVAHCLPPARAPCGHLRRHSLRNCPVVTTTRLIISRSPVIRVDDRASMPVLGASSCPSAHATVHRVLRVSAEDPRELRRPLLLPHVFYPTTPYSRVLASADVVPLPDTACALGCCCRSITHSYLPTYLSTCASSSFPSSNLPPAPPASVPFPSCPSRLHVPTRIRILFYTIMTRPRSRRAVALAPASSPLPLPLALPSFCLSPHPNSCLPPPGMSSSAPSLRSPLYLALYRHAYVCEDPARDAERGVHIRTYACTYRTRCTQSVYTYPHRSCPRRAGGRRRRSPPSSARVVVVAADVVGGLRSAAAAACYIRVRGRGGGAPGW
ncbi:hypothetical protein C8Q80DRAFT_433168 [Daedaleopsis nitida]|nr:hypothetical protein C8Q80DRAFT_433168 [Daedaleopsis nitida]